MNLDLRKGDALLVIGEHGTLFEGQVAEITFTLKNDDGAEITMLWVLPTAGRRRPQRERRCDHEVRRGLPSRLALRLGKQLCQRRAFQDEFRPLVSGSDARRDRHLARRP